LSRRNGREPLPAHVRPEDPAHDDVGFHRINDEHDALAARFPLTVSEHAFSAVGTRHRAAIAVWRPAARPVSTLRVLAKTPLHDLAELQRVIVRQHSLQTLDEMPRDAGLFAPGSWV
jgi:hypothetical protein